LSANSTRYDSCQDKRKKKSRHREDPNKDQGLLAESPTDPVAKKKKKKKRKKGGREKGGGKKKKTSIAAS